MTPSQRILTALVLGGCIWAVACVGAADGPSAPPPAKPGVRIVDDLRYESAEAAQAAWRAEEKRDAQGARIAQESVAPVQPLTIGGRPVLKLTRNFRDTTLPRGVWDRRVALDLALAAAISFDVYAENLRAIGSAHLYLKSGDGWYGCKWYPKTEGEWNHVRLRKSHFYVDKPAAGWSKVETVRFSPWAMQREDATLYIANLGVEESPAAAFILRQEYAEKERQGDQKSSVQFTRVVSDLLEDSGVALPVITTHELTPGLLQRVKLVIIPYASRMTGDVAKILADYLDSGGKVIACFSPPGAIAERLGVSPKGWRGREFVGEFGSMRLVDGELPGLPRAVRQGSWGLIQVQAIAGRGRVAAWWHSEDGQQTDAPAIVLSDKGAYFSHVLLEDDAANKRALLKGLVAQFCPAVLKQACETRMAKVGEEVGAADFDEAVRLVSALPAFNRQATDALSEARKRYAEANSQRADGRFDDAFKAAEQADAQLVAAYCLAQRSQWPEFRATWCHPVVGIAGWTWDRTASVLKTSGMDHLILNALHGASAGYRSQVLPTDASLPAGSDAFGECIRACQKHGLKLHVWMTNYQLHGHAPPEFVARLKTEGRLQVTVEGEPAEQLCPSDDRNVALQRDAMVEAARIPGVDGIHFDYIRYPDNRTCCCPTCRAKFEQRLGRPLAQWPQDVARDKQVQAEWAQFRCDNITRLVREVHDEVRRAAPKCMISAAVFNNYPACRDSVGQDWKVWIEKGYLDFVCPMNYTASDAQFAALVKNQLDLVGGKTPCYPGIGLLEGLGPVGAARQIQITRQCRTGGFVLWSVYPQYMDVYPHLGKGILAR